jgi:hypothetical protein
MKETLLKAYLLPVILVAAVVNFVLPIPIALSIQREGTILLTLLHPTLGQLMLLVL